MIMHVPCSQPYKVQHLVGCSAIFPIPLVPAYSQNIREYLVRVISPAYHQSLPVPSVDVALAQWSKNHTLDPPQVSTSCKQKV